MSPPLSIQRSAEVERFVHGSRRSWLPPAWKSKRGETSMAPKLYVGGLSFETTEAEDRP